MKSGPFCPGIASAVFLAFATPACAQDDAPTPASEQTQEADSDAESDSGITSFAAGFFADSNPANARDMVGRLPGFSFNGGNSSTRGFSGSAGNVLIDGAVASTKSVTLDDILRRIPTSNVERIDVIRGGARGIDMQGFAVVANVIRKSGQTTAGAIQFSPAVTRRGNWQVGGRTEISHRTDNFSLDASMDAQSNGFKGEQGTQARYDLLGQIKDQGPFVSDGYETSYAGNGAAEYRMGDLGTIRLNASANTRKTRRDIYYHAIDPNGVETVNASPSLDANQGFELGSDYEGALDGFTVTALGLYRRSFQENSSSNASTATVSSRKTPNGETIARATMRNDPLSWLTLQASAEGALNFRDTKSFLDVAGVAQALPNSNVRVEERRAEFSGTANIVFWPEFRAELAMRYETSVISQIGDTNRKQAFTFGKPRAILTYDVTPQTQLRVRAERRVGQLDFGSFAASNDAVLGTVTAGNANLEPERAWEYEGTIERHFWRQGSISLSYLHASVEKINDRILVVTPAGIFDAPGNIGDGVRDRVFVNATIPFDPLGLPDLRLMADATWSWSQVSDPVTHLLRGTSGEGPFFANVTLAQDVPSWNSTFGIGGNNEPRRTNYLLKELRQEKLQPRLRFYWNWQARPDFQLNFTIENAVFKRERLRTRILFGTSRDVGDFSGSETLRVSASPQLRLQLRKTF